MKTHGGRYLESAELRALGCRAVGENVQVHDTCLIVGLENLTIGDNVRVDAFCCLLPGEGSIRVGNHVHIAANVFLSGGEGIEIDDFVGLSHSVKVYTRNDDYTGAALTGPTIPVKYLKLTKGAVRFGRHVVVGAGSIVLPGVTIEEGSTVGALSLVKSDLSGWGIFAGVPVRRLRERRRDLLKLEAELHVEENEAAALRRPAP